MVNVCPNQTLYIYMCVCVCVCIRVLLLCKINFLFDKFVGGKQLIVVAGIGWAYFIPKIKKGIQFHGFTQGCKKGYGERTEK